LLIETEDGKSPEKWLTGNTQKAQREPLSISLSFC
jgi:hypothetical protein